MKKALSFIGKIILIISGVIMIYIVESDIFEESIAFFEISPLEAVFFVTLFFLIKRHITASSVEKLSWSHSLYLPLRNLGWFFLLILVYSIYNDSQYESHINSYEYEKIDQLILFGCIAFCIYIAAPVRSKNKDVDGGEDAHVRVKT